MPGKKTEKEAISWEAAFDELNAIVSSLENDAIAVDVLSEKMERASELIKLCSTKLRDTEEAVNRIIRDMDDPGPIAPEQEDQEPF